MKLGAVLLALSLVPVAAAKWATGESDHFEIFTDAGDKTANRTLNYLEHIHSFLTTSLKLESALPAKTRLIVFSNSMEYKEFVAQESIAFFQPSRFRDHIMMKAAEIQTYPAVIYLYTQLTFRYLAPRMPGWAKLGIGELYRTLNPDGDKMIVGTANPAYVSWLRTHPSVPLPQLFQPPARMEGETLYQYRAQSWALMHMLMCNPLYQPGRIKFLELSNGGTDSVAAIQEAFGRSLNQVSTDLSEYMASGQYTVQIYNDTGPKDRDWEVKDIAPASEEFMRAALLAAFPGRAREARKAFQALEPGSASDVRFQEAFGYFEMSQNNRSAAVAHFAQANVLKSTDWRLYRDYAAVNTNTDDKAKLMGIAAGMKGADAETRLAYASLLMRTGKYSQALFALQAVGKVRPDQAFSYYSLGTEANIAVARWAEADQAAKQAARFARTDSEQRSLRQLQTILQDQRVAEGLAEPAATAAVPPAASQAPVAQQIPAAAPKPATDPLAKGSAYDGAAYTIGGSVSAPVPTYKPDPAYTEEARLAKFQGSVVLQIVVDEKGKPNDIRVIRPLGLGLDEKAIEAVQKWRFEPGKLNGKPVPVRANVQVNFRLL